LASSNRILLCGNGETSTSFDESVYDTIVRFNWALRDKGRTDVWVDALLRHGEKLRHHYSNAGTPEIWRLNGESKHRMSQMPSEWYPNTTFISERNYQLMRKEFGSQMKPSIGFVTIWWLINIMEETDITLVGFDFGKTKNRYTDEMPYTSHDWNREAFIVQAWVDEGRIKRL